ncbi:2-dehydro-3-deoxygluconokinase [Hydrogenispora ethanolica]|jgi:2-dehydro-3-deoxygluconokinase|uniref:2-dehydro-3-deoxygluconokinase n=1 Tax=Hydrogenispora ethanolica TaxID=1082276 RepID=A0A4R1SA14_HYDET|nr:sugar kinase [Hydrogenispora ethanolica]TCL76268.1 2-dehydro-3-deoxygluconokinase [Hydrogenispora ethanolica]
MSVDLVCFGETLIRLSPPGAGVIEQGGPLNLFLAGSELNVAVAAQRLGLATSYVSKLAANPLGKLVYNKCREQGVATDWIRWSDEYRQGIYFFENGSPPRPGMAYYDRKDSAFCHVAPADFDWPAILAETKLFLTSGINPALSPAAHQVTLDAVRAAKRLGKLVAFDINYRSKLWDTAAAGRVLAEYFPYVDILFISGGDAADVLGFTEPAGDDLALRIAERLGVATVCLIYDPVHQESLWRIAAASDGRLYGAGHQGRLVTVDRLGAGDAFTAGFLTGFLESGPALGVELGNAMMTLKNTYYGDFTWATREQIDAYRAGDVSLLKR